MRTFRDKTGRDWPLEITLGGLMRVKDLAGVDMLDMPKPKNGEQPVAQRLMSDVSLLADVLCAVLRPQITAAGLNDESFADCLGGTAIDDALIALLEEWADFFRQRNRPDLQKTLQVVVQTLMRIRAKAAQVMSAIDPADVSDRICGVTFGNAPASSVSIPVPSPSANST